MGSEVQEAILRWTFQCVSPTLVNEVREGEGKTATSSLLSLVTFFPLLRRNILFQLVGIFCCLFACFFCQFLFLLWAPADFIARSRKTTSAEART